MFNHRELTLPARHFFGEAMSIVRVGMSETKNYAAGYDAIFGKKKAAAKQPAVKPAAKKPGAKAKKK